MKTVLLSIAVLVYGYFCDICRAICEKSAEYLLKKDKPLCKKTIAFFCRFTENSFEKWQKLEKKLILRLLAEQTF